MDSELPSPLSQPPSWGAKVEHYTLQVNTAAMAGKLEVAWKVASLIMATTPQTFLVLKDNVVYHNLSHPLNLGLNFLTEFKAH
ncbi:MAG: hypothetical protein GY696_39955 [Gammaproteobacteria bacterium]|nr:hypothetical protein [Gammaproteobacteria bacterium]